MDLRAQRADYSAIKKNIEAKFWVDLDTVNLCETIIFNGVVYDFMTINKELKKYKLDEILITELADLSKSSLAHLNCYFMIFLGSSYNQSKEDKVRILDNITNNLNRNVPELKIHDFFCSKCMQVIIDGRPYGVYDAKKIVNSLKAKDIKYIAEYESANPSVYGQNAKNGLIEVFLTETKKRKNSR
ncbi:hypothetical protein [Peijinzhouia sedimentorum]